MKILIISYSDSGGAGLAALRLHKALLAAGECSHLLCFNRQSNVINVTMVQKTLWGRTLEHLPLPLWNNKYRKFASALRNDYECVSFPNSIDYLTEHPLVKDADVINLHWVGSVLSYKNFFKKVRKPIIWTLHDMNPFLGCAHFNLDVKRYPKWQNLENILRIRKEKWINQAKFLEIVDLCTWMQGYSASSGAFSRYVHHIIRNSVDTSIYRPYNQHSIRDILDIPWDKRVLMFVSQNINNYRKGYDLLLKALERVDNCFMMVIGAHTESLGNKNNVRYLDTVKDERLMAFYYAAADVFLLPSREDNLPNTMVESLCCGTPVVTMPNGGMTDIIKNGYNGYISEKVDANSFAEAINEYLAKGVSLNRNEIAEEAHRTFSPSMQAKAYLAVFSNAIKQHEKTV